MNESTEKSDADEFLEILSGEPDHDAVTDRVQQIWLRGALDGDDYEDVLKTIKSYLQGVYGDDASIVIVTDDRTGNYTFEIEHDAYD
jgi:hypothetical protein